MLLVVIGVAGILWSGERAHRKEQEIYDHVRAARGELIEAWQAQNEAEALAARYLATGDRALLAGFDRAKRSARMRLAGLRAIVSEDPDALAFVGRIEPLVERRFEALATEAEARGRSSERPELSIYAAFREESAALLRLFNARIDRARAAQEANRQQINLAALTLAALTLIACALCRYWCWTTSRSRTRP